MSKSLKILQEDARRERLMLLELLPERIERQKSGMRAKVGIEGLLVKDLKEDLGGCGYRFTPTQIKNALKELGWESFKTLIPGRSKRVRVWVKTVQAANRCSCTQSENPEWTTKVHPSCAEWVEP